MRMGRLGLVAVFLLFVATPAMAAQGVLEGRAQLPIEVTASHTASAADSHFVLEGMDGSVALLLQSESGEATRVIHRAFGFVNTQDPQLRVMWRDEIERIPLQLPGSLISLEERRSEFRLLVDQGDARLTDGPAAGPLLVGVLDGAKTVDYQLADTMQFHLMPAKDSDAFAQTIPSGSYQSRATDGRLVLDGPFRLFLTDAVVGYGLGTSYESLPEHFRIEKQPGSIFNPLTEKWFGGGEHDEYVQEYLLIEGVGHLEIQFSDVAGSLFAPTATVAIAGPTELSGFDGTIAIDDGKQSQVHEVDGQDLGLDGAYTLTFSEPLQWDGDTRVDGTGDFTTVSYAGTTAHYDWTPVVAAVSLGAIVLAILGWIVSSGKTIAPAAGLVAGYARVHGQEVLEHPGRQEVYERVKAEPGVSFMQLAGRVTFGASSLQYHLRVLEKNGYVTCVKDGRHLRFFDRTAGTYSGARKTAVSTLRNTTTAAIAQHIVTNPGVAQCDLASQFEVTASTVSWHIDRLAAAGLVQRSRDRHFTRYYAGEAWATLPASEQARLATPLVA